MKSVLGFKRSPAALLESPEPARTKVDNKQKRPKLPGVSSFRHSRISQAHVDNLLGEDEAPGLAAGNPTEPDHREPVAGLSVLGLGLRQLSRTSQQSPTRSPALGLHYSLAPSLPSRTSLSQPNPTDSQPVDVLDRAPSAAAENDAVAWCAAKLTRSAAALRSILKMSRDAQRQRSNTHKPTGRVAASTPSHSVTPLVALGSSSAHRAADGGGGRGSKPVVQSASPRVRLLGLRSGELRATNSSGNTGMCDGRGVDEGGGALRPAKRLRGAAVECVQRGAQHDCTAAAEAERCGAVGIIVGVGGRVPGPHVSLPPFGSAGGFETSCSAGPFKVVVDARTLVDVVIPIITSAAALAEAVAGFSFFGHLGAWPGVGSVGDDAVALSRSARGVGKPIRSFCTCRGASMQDQRSRTIEGRGPPVDRAVPSRGRGGEALAADGGSGRRGAGGGSEKALLSSGRMKRRARDGCSGSGAESQVSPSDNSSASVSTSDPTEETDVDGDATSGSTSSDGTSSDGTSSVSLLQDGVCRACGAMEGCGESHPLKVSRSGGKSVRSDAACVLVRGVHGESVSEECLHAAIDAVTTALEVLCTTSRGVFGCVAVQVAVSVVSIAALAVQCAGGARAPLTRLSELWNVLRVVACRCRVAAIVSGCGPARAGGVGDRRPCRRGPSAAAAAAAAAAVYNSAAVRHCDAAVVTAAWRGVCACLLALVRQRAPPTQVETARRVDGACVSSENALPAQPWRKCSVSGVSRSSSGCPTGNPSSVPSSPPSAALCPSPEEAAVTALVGPFESLAPSPLLPPFAGGSASPSPDAPLDDARLTSNIAAVASLVATEAIISRFLLHGLAERAAIAGAWVRSVDAAGADGMKGVGHHHRSSDNDRVDDDAPTGTHGGGESGDIPDARGTKGGNARTPAEEPRRKAVRGQANESELSVGHSAPVGAKSPLRFTRESVRIEYVLPDRLLRRFGCWLLRGVSDDDVGVVPLVSEAKRMRTLESVRVADRSFNRSGRGRKNGKMGTFVCGVCGVEEDVGIVVNGVVQTEAIDRSPPQAAAVESGEGDRLCGDADVCVECGAGAILAALVGGAQASTAPSSPRGTASITPSILSNLLAAAPAAAPLGSIAGPSLVCCGGLLALLRAPSLSPCGVAASVAHALLLAGLSVLRVALDVSGCAGLTDVRNDGSGEAAAAVGGGDGAAGGGAARGGGYSSLSVGWGVGHPSSVPHQPGPPRDSANAYDVVSWAPPVGGEGSDRCGAAGEGEAATPEQIASTTAHYLFSQGKAAGLMSGVAEGGSNGMGRRMSDSLPASLPLSHGTASAHTIASLTPSASVLSTQGSRILRRPADAAVGVLPLLAIAASAAASQFPGGHAEGSHQPLPGSPIPNVSAGGFCVSRSARLRRSATDACTAMRFAALSRAASSFATRSLSLSVNVIAAAVSAAPSDGDKFPASPNRPEAQAFASPCVVVQRDTKVSTSDRQDASAYRFHPDVVDALAKSGAAADEVRHALLSICPSSRMVAAAAECYALQCAEGSLAACMAVAPSVYFGFPPPAAWGALKVSAASLTSALRTHRGENVVASASTPLQPPPSKRPKTTALFSGAHCASRGGGSFSTHTYCCARTCPLSTTLRDCVAVGSVAALTSALAVARSVLEPLSVGLLSSSFEMMEWDSFSHATATAALSVAANAVERLRQSCGWVLDLPILAQCAQFPSVTTAGGHRDYYGGRSAAPSSLWEHLWTLWEMVECARKRSEEGASDYRIAAVAAIAAVPVAHAISSAPQRVVSWATARGSGSVDRVGSASVSAGGGGASSSVATQKRFQGQASGGSTAGEARGLVVGVVAQLHRFVMLESATFMLTEDVLRTVMRASATLQKEWDIVADNDVRGDT